MPVCRLLQVVALSFYTYVFRCVGDPAIHAGFGSRTHARVGGTVVCGALDICRHYSAEGSGIGSFGRWSGITVRSQFL
ncbi:uncharacterized protein GGS22DRAFT_152490 [Annulohypoxylon maeteangense]|uniref:uncharacterized protein n=1 Tax=Annulohypoxylon maeteangense TaxID=1927788 RepID=UPI0020085FB0|nr:uncharacterized protein GGS22DRAFT_152490 [Annulohypoxylon maeteangense]KAI0888835.1 hypothetical protein GGS22DRAFT_152490 [Annulohypoxylon maeteangense]